MSIVYISYPRNLGYVPSWWNILKQDDSMKLISCYDPGGNLMEVIQQDKEFAELLAETVEISTELFKLPPQLREGLTAENLAMIETGDRRVLAKAEVWRDLYVLMRSDVVLADLNSLEIGSRTLEMVYAKLWGIPIIGVSDNMTNSPAHLSLLDVVVPSNIDNLVGMIGHKISERRKATRDSSKTEDPQRGEEIQLDRTIELGDSQLS